MLMGIQIWYAWYRPGYSVPAFPAIEFLVVSSAWFVIETFPNHRAQLRTMLGIFIAALVIASLPPFERLSRDQYFQMSELTQIDSDMDRSVRVPAIVLFHFTPGLDNAEEEPVYNSEVENPLEAQIIRAHDRNEDDSVLLTSADRNRDVYSYLQKADPNRAVYLYNRNGRHAELRYLGQPAQIMARIGQEKP